MKKGKYRLLVLVICVINFVAMLPLVNRPPVHDETNYFEGVRTIAQNNLNPFVEFWGYKPPMMFEIPALLIKLFGESMIWGRLYVFLLSSLTLWYLYLVGKILFNEKVALGGVITLGCFTLFVVQGTLFMDPVPQALFVLMVVYYFAKRDWWRLTLSGIMLAMTKEPAIILFPMLMVVELLNNKKNNDSKKIIFGLVSPLVVFGLWLMINKAVLGWYLWPFNTNLFDINNIFQYDYVNIYLRNVFWDKSLFLVSSLVLVGVLTKKRNKTVLGILCLVILDVLMYMLLSPMVRYVLPVYPLYFLVFAYYCDIFFQKNYYQFILICAVLSVTISLYQSNFGGPFRDLGDSSDYRSISMGSKIFKEVGQYIDDTYPGHAIAIEWPGADYFSDTSYGYINGEHNIISFDVNKGCKLDFSKVGNILPDSEQVLLIRTSSDNCNYGVSGWKLTPLKVFSAFGLNGNMLAEARIYLLTKSALIRSFGAP